MLALSSNWHNAHLNGLFRVRVWVFNCILLKLLTGLDYSLATHEIPVCWRFGNFQADNVR